MVCGHERPALVRAKQKDIISVVTDGSRRRDRGALTLAHTTYGKEWHARRSDRVGHDLRWVTIKGIICFWRAKGIKSARRTHFGARNRIPVLLLAVNEHGLPRYMQTW